MRTRLPVLLLVILVVLLFVNLGKALQHAPLEADATVAVATRSSDATRYTLKDDAGASSKDAYRDGDGERLIDRTFDVSSGDDLSVRVDHANVEVVTGASDQARVEVFLDARDMERARRYFDDLRFEVEQRDNTVSVTTNRRPGMNWSSSRSGGARITVRIAVPETFDADLRLSHGDLDLGALTGRTSVQASHGDVETASLRGPSLSFELSHGDLDADRLEAEAIRLRTSHGDLDLGTVIAGRLDAAGSHGDIRIAALEGDADVADSHGEIAVRFTKAGTFDFRNSHGDITVRMPADVPGNLQLSGSSVRIASEFQFQGTVRSDRADGRINGGGPRMEARTTHGSVTLRAE